MLRSLLSRLERLARGDAKSEKGAESDGGFRPSELDASVLYAHGADVGRLEDEIADIEERANELETVRSDK